MSKLETPIEMLSQRRHKLVKHTHTNTTIPMIGFKLRSRIGLIEMEGARKWSCKNGPMQKLLQVDDTLVPIFISSILGLKVITSKIVQRGRKSRETKQDDPKKSSLLYGHLHNNTHNMCVCVVLSCVVPWIKMTTIKLSSRTEWNRTYYYYQCCVVLCCVVLCCVVLFHVSK